MKPGKSLIPIRGGTIHRHTMRWDTLDPNA